MADRELHIGMDADKVVVAPYPLRMRHGRGRKRRTGSVTELLPVPASGRGREERSRLTAQQTLVAVIGSAALDLAGVPWWLPAGASAVTIGLIAWRQARAARTGVVAVPPGEQRHVLVTREERTAYEGALLVTRRIRNSWPALAPMIDPVEADLVLTRALDDLAAALARRQELRRLRAELEHVNLGGLPADSPAVTALIEQRERLNELWHIAGTTANRILAGINAAALAGDNLLREQRIGVTAQHAEATITQLAAIPPGSATAAADLALRTAAVVTAYRELAAIR